ncbi:MAG: NAD(+) diphosphatase, partial [Gammaproteobacteria bacterium]
RARQVLDWAADHRFCSRCGSTAQAHDSDRATVCTACGYTQYPRLAPCVIVLVTRGDEVLLARSPRFPPGVFSTLAGFIEAGENVEEALAREVQEEVGVTIARPRYIGSQSWPFPNSLMLGFHAEWAGGEIAVDGEEIVEAQWFSLDALPLVPPRGSISRQLLDAYVRRRQTGEDNGR